MSYKIDVHGLPAKWREPTPIDDQTLYTMGRRNQRKQCADELEAALRQSGEAVAVVMADGYPLWLRSWLESSDYRNLPAGTKLYAAPPTTSGLVEALRWYAEQVEGCRKIGHLGDHYRHALDSDGGKRAREALAAHDAQDLEQQPASRNWWTQCEPNTDLDDANAEIGFMREDWQKVGEALGFTDFVDPEVIIATITTLRQQPALVVDDALVDAAIAAQDAHWANDDNYPACAPRSVKGDARLHDKLARGAMRAALTAALARAHGVQP